ncbi:hypothetical protein [Streptomyces scabiei]|uniref:hypothetical protein n=1 Tax=Streptomyces scabiei TaxID=1930 RepID=UPI0029BF962C|nr:hypothetical protein [Streptomyces scabiei]MDX3122758.1 hypothetical protein [Streptomyces scabiei]MDX3199357.1 hypothetical protein [Streptomyces scabiei]MDX3223203.1 hypothetical protein [Streptomyces scabiei]
MNTLLDAGLTPDQHNLLATIGRSWLDRGDWPVWRSVQHHFDNRGVDADAVLHSLPRVGTHALFPAGYGFTTPMRPPINPRDQVRLTIASSLVLPEVRMTAGEPFVRTLEHMIDLYASNPVPHNDAPHVMLRSGELATAVPSLKQWFIKVLPDLLSHEPAVNTDGGAGFVNGSWERELNRSVWAFRGVRSIEAYVEKTIEIVTARAAQFDKVPAVKEEQTPTATPARGPYIDEALLDDLAKVAGTTKWNLDKLIALCRELNYTYTGEMPYASAALIRAILDHIPRAFQQQEFKYVASHHKFAVQKTDKAHAQRLAAFKDIADDVMHRPIGPGRSVIAMDDLPEPARLRAMLRELLTLL